MILNFNSDELNRAVNDFYYATGINIVLVDTNFNPLTTNIIPDNFCFCLQCDEAGYKKCKLSDLELIKKCEKKRQIVQHICHAGLIDTAVPLIVNNEIIAFLIIGQMRTDKSFDYIYSNLSGFQIDRKLLQEKYDRLPYCDENRMESIINIASMLTEFILLKNLLKPKYDTYFESATQYINDNISKDISIKEICNALNVSKNVLYKVFHKNLDCTIGEYINSVKIKKAKELLLNSNLDIQQISEKVGISNYTYFCKLFKKHTGTTPKKYKNPQK